MRLFTRLRKRFFVFLKRRYYYHFGEKNRYDYSIITLHKRTMIAGVRIQPVTKLQWTEIKNRFRGFKVDKKWFDYYNTVWKTQQPERSYDVTKVIPGSIFYPYVDPVFSHPLEAKTTSDKNLTDLLFPDIRRPRTIIRFQDGLFMNGQYGIITREEALESVRRAGDVVVKPSAASGGGHGIVFWNADTDGDGVLENLFSGRHSYVVQERLIQHERMNALNAGSVNTIRLETFLWENKVHLLSGIVRMGGKGSRVDNLSSGGMSCGIDLENGQLSPKAYDFNHLNITYKKHPDGCEFNGFVIPSWKKCVSMVKNVAPRFGRVAKLIAWDIAIDEDGEPVLIECNMMDSGCESLQFDNGPLFGDLTDEVLDYVRANRRRLY